MAIKMDPAQLAQLVAALQGRGGGDKKTPELSSSSAEDWRTWRSNFEVLAVMNGWDNRRQNFEVFIAMTGEAKQLVSGIGHGNPAAPLGVELLRQDPTPPSSWTDSKLDSSLRLPGKSPACSTNKPARGKASH